MENPILEHKIELIEWIKTLDDLEVLNELLILKDNENSISKVAESQAEYFVKDDFDERFAKGIPHEEMKRRTIEHIRNLQYKQ